MGSSTVKIAVPVVDDVLSSHFGHCTQFALFDVDPTQRSILGRQDLPAPEHRPGLLPEWLSARGANVIIAGNMGGRARDLFAEQQVTVVTGAPEADPRELVAAYLAGTLVSDDTTCTNHERGCHH
jgi:ATP-binding protein involved in chromosome partitioning